MKKKADTRKIKLAGLLWIMAVILLYLIIYVAPGVTDIFVESYIAEYGTVEVEQEIDYLCVRNERVHTSDNTGSVKRLIEAGNLVRNNSKIASVGGMNYYSRIRGIVSYVYDGLEKTYSSETLYDIKQEDVTGTPSKGVEPHSVKSCASKTAEPGNPIYKIVDNSAWYFVGFLSAEELKPLTAGQSVRIRISENDKLTLPFRVLDIEAPEETGAESESADKEDGEESAEKTENEDAAEVEKKYRIILVCDRHYEDFDKLRFGKAKIITSRKTGIILESSSVVTEDGRKGVYVLNKYNNYVFTPISIIAETGDVTIVENRVFYDAASDTMVNTVKNYDSVKKGESENVN